MATKFSQSYAYKLAAKMLKDRNFCLAQTRNLLLTLQTLQVQSGVTIRADATKEEDRGKAVVLLARVMEAKKKVREEIRILEQEGLSAQPSLRDLLLVEQNAPKPKADLPSPSEVPENGS